MLTKFCNILVVWAAMLPLTYLLTSCGEPETVEIRTKRVKRHQQYAEQLQVFMHMCDNNGGIRDVDHTSGRGTHYVYIVCNNGLSGRFEQY